MYNSIKIMYRTASVAQVIRIKRSNTALADCFLMVAVLLVLMQYLYRPISLVVIGRELDYYTDLDLYVFVQYCLTNTTLCL